MQHDQKSVTEIVGDYFKSNAEYAQNYLYVKWSTGKSDFFKMKVKFTDHYGQYVYASLQMVKLFQLSSFWTLTIRNTDNLHQDNERIRKGWKSFRSILSRNGIKKPDYFRVYELTDKLRIHIHVAFYTDIDKYKIWTIADYWQRNYGFSYVYYFDNHDNDGLLGQTADRWRLWYEKMRSHSLWIFEGNERYAGRVNQYVMKYMVKVPEFKKRAMIKYYRLRSYSVFRRISKLIVANREAYSNVYEDKGNPMEVGLLDLRTKNYYAVAGGTDPKLKKFVESLNEGFLQEKRKKDLKIVFERTRIKIFIELYLKLDEREKSSSSYMVNCYLVNSGYIFDNIVEERYVQHLESVWFVDCRLRHFHNSTCYDSW